MHNFLIKFLSLAFFFAIGGTKDLFLSCQKATLSSLRSTHRQKGLQRGTAPSFQSFFTDKKSLPPSLPVREKTAEKIFFLSLKKKVVPLPREIMRM